MCVPRPTEVIDKLIGAADASARHIGWCTEWYKAGDGDGRKGLCSRHQTNTRWIEIFVERCEGLNEAVVADSSFVDKLRCEDLRQAQPKQLDPRWHNGLVGGQWRTVAGCQWEDLSAVAENVATAQVITIAKRVLDLCQKIVAVVCVRSRERIVVPRRHVHVGLREELQEV